MAYVFSDVTIGLQAITDHDTTQNHRLGMLTRAEDPTYGGGEFIYLLGVASTVVGDVVTYNATTHQTTRLANTANLAAPVAVAMSANVASEYGWYQIGGLAVVKKTAVTWEPQKAAFISGTTGRVMDTTASGKQILGAKSANLTTVTSTTSTIVLQISRPHCQGQVT